MIFRFYQTSKTHNAKKEDIDDIVREHRSVKKDKDGNPIVEINSIEELTSFIKNECCSENEAIVGYCDFYGGWYIEDYDTWRE